MQTPQFFRRSIRVLSPILTVVAVLACGHTALAADNANTLWYPRAAEKWVEALPVGNGRLGRDGLRRRRHERLQLNEDNVWAGCTVRPGQPGGVRPVCESAQVDLRRQSGRGAGAAEGRWARQAVAAGELPNAWAN